MVGTAKTKQRLIALDVGLSQFNGLGSEIRQKQEYMAEHWNELYSLCSTLIEGLEFDRRHTKKLVTQSDRIHGEAFAAGISGACEDCKEYAELESQLQQRDKEIERLKAINKYAGHKKSCNPKRWRNTCDCGYLQALCQDTDGQGE